MQQLSIESMVRDRRNKLKHQVSFQNKTAYFTVLVVYFILTPLLKKEHNSPQNTSCSLFFVRNNVLTRSRSTKKMSKISTDQQLGPSSTPLTGNNNVFLSVHPVISRDLA